MLSRVNCPCWYRLVNSFLPSSSERVNYESFKITPRQNSLLKLLEEGERFWIEIGCFAPQVDKFIKHRCGISFFNKQYTQNRVFISFSGFFPIPWKYYLLNLNRRIISRSFSVFKKFKIGKNINLGKSRWTSRIL